MENKLRDVLVLRSCLIASFTALLLLQGMACTRGSSGPADSNVMSGEAMKAESQKQRDAQKERARRVAYCLTRATEQPAVSGQAITQFQNCLTEVFGVGKDPGGNCGGDPFDCMEGCNAVFRRAQQAYDECIGRCSSGPACNYCAHQLELAQGTFDGCIWCCALSTGLR